MTGKIIKTAMGFALLSCLLAGCTSKDVTDEIEEVRDVVYVPSYSEYEYCLDYNEDRVNSVESSFCNKFIKNNIVYSVSRIYTREKGMQDYLEVLDLATGEQRQQPMGAAGSYFEYAEGFISFANNKLCVYDEAFAPVKEINLQGLNNALRENGNRLSCDDVVMCGDDIIGIISGEIIVFTDGEGNMLRYIERPSVIKAFNRLVVTASGDWYVLCDNTDSKLVIHNIDMEQCMLGEALNNVPEVYYNRVYALGQAEENGFYFSTDNYIYQYDTQTGQFRELFCLRDYGITVNGYTAFGAEDGVYYIVNETGDYIKETDETKQVIGLELAAISGVPAKEIQPREEIVMATFSEPYLKYREPIMRFNKYNPDYYVTVKCYYDREEYDTAQQNFYNDLITGKGADIFWVDNYNVNIKNLSEKGAIADLYEYMDADEELGREDFISNILASMEYDGKLYALSPTFSLETLSGKASLLEEYSQWDFNALYDLMEKYPDACLVSPWNQDSALRSFAGWAMDSFYDEVTGECFFDSQEFVKLLEIIETLPTGYDYSTPMQELIRDDMVLLYHTSITNCTAIKWTDVYFGDEEIRYIGYPATGSGAIIIYNYLIAMSAQSEKKQGAWEFIKSYFMEDYQKNSYNLPVIQQYFDEMLEEEMAECDYDSAGDVYGTTIKGEVLTIEQAQTMRDLVASAVKTNEFDKDIYNIIVEETQSFLAGQKSAQEAAGIIQDRVQLYIDEKQ